MKKIAKLLKADLNGTSDLAAIASMLSSKGRGNDTLLAHITPREAQILKAAGGSGTTNPDTGLLEFYDGESDFEAMPSSQAEFAQAQEAAQTYPVYQGDVVGTQLPPLEAETTPRTRSLARGAEFVQAPPQAAVAPIGTSGGAEQDVMLSSFPTAQAPSQFAGRDVALGEAALRDAVSSAPQEKSLFDKLGTEQMARLGLAGGLGLYGATQAKRGAQQSQAAAAEQRAVGAPYQAKGQELQRAAQTGELTPTGQQSLQALQARLAQGAQSRGGVGVAQAAQQLEAYRQQLLAQQYDLGLKVSNIGDNIALGAIKTGLAADQALNQASANFYTNLAAIGAGIPITQTRTA
jgi:hypothetical protein